jgi:hypothetical protein
LKERNRTNLFAPHLRNFHEASELFGAFRRSWFPGIIKISTELPAAQNKKENTMDYISLEKRF